MNFRSARGLLSFISGFMVGQWLTVFAVMLVLMLAVFLFSDADFHGGWSMLSLPTAVAVPSTIGLALGIWLWRRFFMSLDDHPRLQNDDRPQRTPSNRFPARVIHHPFTVSAMCGVFGLGVNLLTVPCCVSWVIDTEAGQSETAQYLVYSVFLIAINVVWPRILLSRLWFRPMIRKPLGCSYKVLCGVIVPIGILALIGLQIWNWTEYIHTRNWVPAPAQIQTLHITAYNDGELAEPWDGDGTLTCEYTYTFAGASFTGNQVTLTTFIDASDRSRHYERLQESQGQDGLITVWLDPHDPSESVIFREVVGDMYVFPILGIVLVLVVIVAIWFERRKRRAALTRPAEAPANESISHVDT